jgi:hypothetical protein
MQDKGYIVHVHSAVEEESENENTLMRAIRLNVKEESWTATITINGRS